MNKFPMGQLPFVFRFWWLWELIAFILVGYWIGFGWAFLLLILGSVFGFLLIRGQGVAMMKQMKTEPIQGTFKMMHAIESSFIILSGLLFLIPGFITDVIALACLIPACRRGLVRKVLGFNLRDFAKPAANQAPKSDAPDKSNTIEGEFWHEDGKDEPKN